MKIAQVVLFTNRNTLFFDEAGEQIQKFQELIHSGSDFTSYKYSKERHDLFEQLMKDKPEIVLAQWSTQTSLKLNLDEFLALLGFGEWYTNYKSTLALAEQSKGVEDEPSTTL